MLIVPVPTAFSGPSPLCVLLLRSTDAPDLAVAAIRAAHAAQTVDLDQFAKRPPVTLLLDAEGVRIAAKGVLGALSTGGRPNLVAWVEEFVARDGNLLVVEPAWRDRGFLDDALVRGARLVGPGQLARLAADRVVIASY